MTSSFAPITKVLQPTYELMHIMLVQAHPALSTWIGTLLFVNLIAPLLLWNETDIASKVVAVFHVQAVWMSWLYARHGFGRLLGLAHAGWLIMLPWIFFRLANESENLVVYKWLVSLLIIDSISVILDINDVVRYIKGETSPIAYYKNATTKKQL